jgi:hypothetical protein
MNQSDYDFSIKPIRNFLYECLILPKNGGTKFGIMVQSQVPPSVPWLINHFTTQPKTFFIDVEVTTIVETSVVVPADSVPSEG